MADRTTTDWARTLGAQVRALRIERGLEQADVAERASLSRPAVSGLENGTGSSLATLTKVLIALDADEWLGTLNPATTVPSPLELLRQQRRTRAPQRVRKARP